MVGGKITGYRAIAEDVTDRVCRRLSVRRPCHTAETLLPGAGSATATPPLHDIYGSRAEAVVALTRTNPRLGDRLAPDYPDIAAQVVFSVREELCRGLEDFMLRRSFLGFQSDRGLAALDAVSHLMSRELHWSDARRTGEIDAYRARVTDVLTTVPIS